MGSGIAEVCARSGVDVTVVEVDDDRAERDAREDRASRSTAPRAPAGSSRGRPRGRRRAPRLHHARRGPRGRRRRHRGGDRGRADQARAVPQARRDPARRRVPRLQHLVGADHEARPPTPRSPSRVLGMHFFNPVPVLPLVEIVRSIMTSEQTIDRAHKFAEDTLGKTTIDSQDRAGFVVNALLIPYILSADPHVRVGLRRQGGHRPRHGQGLRPPDGPARARRPDRARHAARRLASRSTRSSATRARSPRRCSTAWSRPACSAARPAAASTTTRARAQLRIDEWRATTCHLPSRRAQMSVSR